jgi:hypothetical protein
MRIGVGLSIPELSTRGGRFSPASLFTSGVVGAWYDPSDYSSLFQDSAGTTPVTAVEQPVGLMRDKSGNNNHASQATTASRPVLRARYNLLTYSEQFDNAAWSKNGVTITANSTTAPDGTTTADKMLATAGNSRHGLSISGVTASGTCVASVYVKYDNYAFFQIGGSSGGFYANFNISTGVVGTSGGARYISHAITNVGSGWYRLSVAYTNATDGPWLQQVSSASDGLLPFWTAAGTESTFVWGAQVDNATSAGTYQRIAAATDYATAGFLPYLATDGTDDTLSSGNIDLTGTSKLSAVVGATKNNDSNVYAIVDFGASGSGTAGGFSMWAGNPASGGAATWASSFQSSAGGVINIVSPTNFAAPATGVVTTILDTVAAGSYLRVNGALQTTSATDPTDGTFGNLPLRLSRSGANGLPGRIYQLVVVGKTLSASELASTEAFVNQKTGAF